MSPGRRRISEAPTRPAPGVILLLILLELVGSGTPHVSGQSAAVLPPTQVSSGQVRWDLELQALRLINDERMAAGLPAVASHIGLRHSARSHALDMLARGYLSHQSLDGRTPQQRALLMNVRVRTVAENVAVATDVHAAHVAFMSSEVHRRTILSRGARLVGIGVVKGGGLGVIVVEDFGQ